MSDEIKRNQPIDRHTFIDEKKSIEAAFSKGTWFVVGKDGESVDEEPIPESIKAAGKIPEGYALDHVLDPSTVISALAKSDITTIDQLPNETLESIKESINSVGNVFLVPIDVVEQKRKATEGALEEMAENPEKMPQDSDTNNTINVEAVHDKVFDNILK